MVRDPAVDQSLDRLGAAELRPDVRAPSRRLEVRPELRTVLVALAAACELGLDLALVDRDALGVGDGSEHEQHLHAMLGLRQVLLAELLLVALGDAEVVLVADALLRQPDTELVEHDLE